MTFRFRQRPARGLPPATLTLALLAAVAGPVLGATYPVTPQQRATAQQVAAAGVPLSELAPNAPDSHVVKRGDTLWAISKIFLRSPWRWPELWGMNLEQIRNPHLIYPGQVLVLEKVDGRARLRIGNAVGDAGTVKLTPQVRSESSEFSAIASIPMNLIGPFLNDAVVFETNELDSAPRIVATPEGHVMLARGDTAYVRGDTAATRSWQIFRAPKPLVDPATGAVLGYEARFVGSAERTRDGESRPGADAGAAVVPSSFKITGVREEAGVGDRLAPAAVRDFAPFVPHSPEAELNGVIISLYGDALSAGQNQIVALNRGKQEGVERGHVLSMWQAGRVTPDPTDPEKPLMKLPDEKRGLMFVFRVFEHVSYALILTADEPAHVGDAFSKP